MVVMEMNMMAFFGRAATVERAKQGDKWQETDSDSGSAAIMVGWTRDDHFLAPGKCPRETKRNHTRCEDDSSHSLFL